MQPISPEKPAREKILESNSTFESERLTFVPAWNITPEQLSLQANNLEIATGVGHEFPHPYTIDNANWFLSYAKTNWESGREYNFAILDKVTNKFCGMIGFKERSEVVSNIGYWLGKDFWGKGVASETLSTTIDFIKSSYPKATAINAFVYKYNQASQKVLLNAGFSQTGEKSSPGVLRNGQPDESFTYSLKI